jgi:hypothetical protein
LGFARNEEKITATFEEGEAAALRSLVDQMRLVLTDDRPGDPARARLFPDAYEDRAEAAAFRDLVGDELRTAKLDALGTVAATLGPAGRVERELSLDEAEAWLRALTDLRLTIGARLKVTEEMMAAEVDLDAPDALALSTLHWLGWLQESLLEQIAGGAYGTGEA